MLKFKIRWPNRQEKQVLTAIYNVHCTPILVPFITKHFGRLGMLNHIFNYHSFVLKRKLPGTPLLLVVPSVPTTSISSGTSSKRARFWHNHLSVLGKVVPVTMHTSNGGSGVSISQCLDHIIGAVRIKVLEVKTILLRSNGQIQKSFCRPHIPRESSFNMTRGGWRYWNSKLEILAAPPPPASGLIF